MNLSSEFISFFLFQLKILFIFFCGIIDKLLEFIFVYTNMTPLSVFNKMTLFDRKEQFKIIHFLG